MSDADARPSRPQYGEYATPEEQRARIQRPEVTDSLDSGVAPQPVPAATEVPHKRARGPLADRAITVVLLVYGLVSTVSTIVQLLDFPGYAERAAQILGVEASYTNLSAGYVWGAAASVVYGIGYLVTAVLTWRRLGRGRISFWVPLVGFVVTTLLAGVCITVALMSDPAFLAALSGAVGS